MPYPIPRRGPEARALRHAISNGRQIHMALMEFETEYGKFPDIDTIDAVKTNSSLNVELGAVSSNQFFRQLLAAQIGNEIMFYAEIAGSRKVDELITRGLALEKGECGFAYFPGANRYSSPSRPLVVTPLIPGTTRFDPKPFDGKAVILKVDGSSTTATINRFGKVRIDGKDLFDPSNPIWEGVAPRIAIPE
jgi:hypothetical protein